MGAFQYSHRVTYADCTAGNHVYYARYLDFLEAARGEFFRALGVTFLDLQSQGTLYPVVECRLRYRAPARYDDLLRIVLWLTVAKGARLNFASRIHGPAGQLLVEAETFHVCTGPEGKPRRLPDSLIRLAIPGEDVDSH
jgi:acyl-CoA thioester hydrolase